MGLYLWGKNDLWGRKREVCPCMALHDIQGASSYVEGLGGLHLNHGTRWKVSGKGGILICFIADMQIWLWDKIGEFVVCLRGSVHRYQ